MAKSTYIGVSNTARKVKKAYIGVNGTAHKVKKIYLGVGGVAKQILGGAEVSYVGTNTGLNLTLEYSAYINSFNKAIISGGIYNGTLSYKIYTIDDSLTVSNPATLSEGTRHQKASKVGQYILFGGGSNSSYACNAVYCFNSSFTLTKETMSKYRKYHTASYNDNYAIFAGGTTNNSQEYQDADAFNSSLTLTSGLSLLSSTTNGVGVSFNHRALFGGFGLAINIFDNSLTRTDVAISTYRNNMNGSYNKNYAIFAGGLNGSSRKTDVDAINKSFTRVATTLDSSRAGGFGIGTDDFAFVACAGNGGSDNTAVLLYDENLTRTRATNSSDQHSNGAGVAVGNKVLLVSGYSCNFTDVYKVD